MPLMFHVTIFIVNPLLDEPKILWQPLDLRSLKLRSLTMPMIGQPAPQFVAPAVVDGGDFKDINLADYKGKYVVLFFYPLDFTFVCPTEIVQFSDRVGEFRSSNCEVLACSIDSQFSHMEYTKKDRKKGGLGKMDIPLIADVI